MWRCVSENLDYNYLHTTMRENLTRKRMHSTERNHHYTQRIKALNMGRNASHLHEPVFGGKTATSAFIYRLVIIIPAVTKYAACSLYTLRHGVRFINAHTWTHTLKRDQMQPVNKKSEISQPDVIAKPDLCFHANSNATDDRVRLQFKITI